MKLEFSLQIFENM